MYFVAGGNYFHDYGTWRMYRHRMSIEEPAHRLGESKRIIRRHVRSGPARHPHHQEKHKTR